MMYATMINDMGFGPSTSVLQRNNSFEDETEKLYYSNLSHTRRVDERGSQSTHLETTRSIKMDLDDCDAMATVNPAEITGQSLAMKMEVDKMDVLQGMERDEGTFDLDVFVNEQTTSSSCIPPAPPVEETQDLIQEMEEFLSQYEDNLPSFSTSSDPGFDNLADQLLSMEQQQTLNSMDTSCPITNGDLSAEDISAAEELVDELLKNTPAPTKDILATAVASENLHDSGFIEEPAETSFNVSNVSQFDTNEGNVIIVIAPPPEPESGSSSPARYDSDSDWSPEECAPKRRPGRKPSSRQPLSLEAGKASKKSYKTIKDKKERKKLQNVMAARRYRDKKKLEAQEAEDEEQTLMRKNRNLKEQLKDIENEMKTMKKLMVELGLFKVVKR